MSDEAEPTLNMLPCPFCGNTNIDFVDEFAGNKLLYYRLCIRCGAQGPAKRTLADAGASWNIRHYTTASCAQRTR